MFWGVRKQMPAFATLRVIVTEGSGGGWLWVSGGVQTSAQLGGLLQGRLSSNPKPRTPVLGIPEWSFIKGPRWFRTFEPVCYEPSCPADLD